MSGTDSKWLLIDQLKSTINGSIRRRQDYLEAKIHDKASAIFNIGLSIPLVEGNMGKFRDYCPVSYIDRDELQKGPNTSQFTAEYEVFLRSKEMYLVLNMTYRISFIE